MTTDADRDFHALRARAAAMHASAERLDAQAFTRRGHNTTAAEHWRRAREQDAFAEVHRMARGADSAPAACAPL